MNKQNLQDDFSKVPEQFHNRVMATLRNLPEKKEYNSMKHLFTKKRFAVVMVSLMVLATTAFAAGKIAQYTIHSGSVPDFTQIPTEKQLEKKIGFVPVTMAEFENGYAFVQAHVGNSSAQDEAGTSVKNFKSLMGVYKKDNSQVSVYAQDFLTLDTTAVPTETANGINLYYSSYTYKIVGLNYQKTEEEKAKEATGELAFGFTNLGDEEPSESFVQSVEFVKDGVQYQVLNMDGTVEQADLMAMAKEIIAQ